MTTYYPMDKFIAAPPLPPTHEMIPVDRFPLSTIEPTYCNVYSWLKADKLVGKLAGPYFDLLVEMTMERLN